jgi:hypothetical protein
MIEITDQEKRMYGVMDAIANSNVPVIYKGALVTKLILRENQFDAFVRETRDIDASWAGESSPPMELLTEMLNHALEGLNLKAIAVREYGEKMSASYDIIDMSISELCMTIDIDMRTAIDSRTYHFGNLRFQGVTPDNVIGDKISVFSSDKVFRRAKDLIDVYALAHCVTVDTDSIRRIWARENRSIGTFDAFKKRKDELRHSYEKLRRVENKPEFDEIYNYLGKFLAPFIDATTLALTWDNDKSGWTDSGRGNLAANKPNEKALASTCQKDKPSILEFVRNYKPDEKVPPKAKKKNPYDHDR